MQSQHIEGRGDSRREERVGVGSEGVWNEMNGSCDGEKVRPLVIMGKRCRLDPSAVQLTPLDLCFNTCEDFNNKGGTRSIHVFLSSAVTIIS